MPKQQQTIHLAPDTVMLLERFVAADATRTKSMVIEAAILTFITPDEQERSEAALIKRLDALVRAEERVERNLDIAIEMQALFLRYWLTATPPLADAAKAAAHAVGKERFEAFVASLGRKLSCGARFSREISYDLAAAPAPGEGEGP